MLGALLLFGAIARWLGRRLRYFKEVEVYSGRDLLFAILAGVMLLFAQGCFFYQITPYFYGVQHVGDVEGVLYYAPFVIGLLVGGLLVARLALRFGARRILALSFVLLGVAMLGLSRGGSQFILLGHAHPHHVDRSRFRPGKTGADPGGRWVRRRKVLVGGASAVNHSPPGRPVMP